MKKLILFLFCCIAANTVSAQDSITPISNKLEPLLYHYYYYRTKVIHETDAYTVMNDTKDPKIMDLVSKTKKARSLQPLGFIAIPAAIATLSFAEAAISKVYNSNGTTDGKLKSNYQTLATTCLIITVACPTFSLMMRHKRKLNMREAVKLYNQKF